MPSLPQVKPVRRSLPLAAKPAIRPKLRECERGGTARVKKLLLLAVLTLLPAAGALAEDKPSVESQVTPEGKQTKANKGDATY